MNNEDFLSNLNSKSGLSILISDEQDSIWGYLLNQDEEIITDCWLANKFAGKMRKIEYYKENNIPPPAKINYIRANILPFEFSKVSFKWTEDGQSVIILYKNENIALLNASEKRGYSKNLMGDGPWGKAWNEGGKNKNITQQGLSGSLASE